MKLEIFSVYDVAVEAYMQPFFAPTKGAAQRSLKDAVNDPKHEFSRHASDYVLFTMGYFDDTTGVFDTAPPLRVVSAFELVNTL